MNKKLSKIILINFFVFILILSVLEVSSRFLIDSEEISPLFNDSNLRTRDRAYVMKHSDRGFSLVPGYTGELYSINRNGFRGRDLPSDIDTRFVVLAIGESTTFGWGVYDDETYPHYLEEILQSKRNDNKPIVINAGVPSYTSSQVLEYIKEIKENKLIKPDLILLNVMWNDIWYSSVHGWSSDLLLNQESSKILSFITSHSRFINYVVMGKKNKRRVDVFNDEALSFYHENIKKIIMFAQDNNIEIAVVAPPFDGDHLPDEGIHEFHIRYTKPFFIDTAMKYQHSLQKVTAELNVPFIHHALDLRHKSQKDFFLDLLHPTSVGNMKMANDVASFILRNYDLKVLD